MPDVDPATRLELAVQIQALDLSTRADRTVAVRVCLVALLRGDLTAGEARAAAGLLAVAQADAPDRTAGEEGADLVGGLLALARRSRAMLDARDLLPERPAVVPAAWEELTRHPEPVPGPEQGLQRRRANEAG